MTFLKPKYKENNIIHRLLIPLALPLVGAVVWLIVLYNQTVNFQHETTGLKLELQKVQAQNAEAKDKFFTLLDAQNLETFSQGRRLVQDKKPRYLEVNTNEWALVSQR